MVVACQEVVTQGDGEYTFLLLPHLHVLRLHLAIGIVGVFVDVEHSSHGIFLRTPLQLVLAVVFVMNQRVAFLLYHAGSLQIAVGVVLPLLHVSILQLSVLREVHELVFADGILRYYLLNRTVESSADGVLVVGTLHEVKHADVVRPVVVIDNGEFDAALVAYAYPRIVMLFQFAMLLLHLVQEVLEVALQHLLRAVGADGDVCRRHHLRLRLDADHEFGADAVELATEEEVFSVAGIAPGYPLGSFQPGNDTVDNAF